MYEYTLEKLSRELFHAYDIRIDARKFDADLALRLFDAQALYFRQYLDAESIIVCRDTRDSGAGYLQLAIQRFSFWGFTVYTDPTPISTCQFYYSCIQRPHCAGVMITASHNPGYYTGQKLVGKNCSPIARNIGPNGGLQCIRRLFLEGVEISKPLSPGAIICINDLDSFVKSSIKLADLSEGALGGLSVVAEFLSGTAGKEILLGLQHCGVNVIPRNLVPDGAFPHGAPNPIVPASIESTLDYLRKRTDYDFCFSFDGDGDRMDVLSSGLVPVEPSTFIAMILPHLEALHPHLQQVQIGLDAKANPRIREYLLSQGIGVKLIPNGHSRIKDLMKMNFSNNMIACAEESAHYYVNVNSVLGVVATENTLFLCLVFLKLWKANPNRLSKLLLLQNSVCRAKEWSYSYPTNTERDGALKQVEEKCILDGYSVVDILEDGSPLGATILRFGNPLCDAKWVHIAQRASESEKGIARWSVISSNEVILEEIIRIIDKIANVPALEGYAGQNGEYENG